MIDLETFSRERANWDVIPFVRELIGDCLTPVAAFRAMTSSDEPAFLLESVEGGEQQGRYSFLGVEPRKSLVLDSRSSDPVIRLREELTPLSVHRRETLPPFVGGAVGLLGWGVSGWSERIPDRHREDTSPPDALLLFFDDVVVFDHVTQTILVISNCFTSSNLEDAELHRTHSARVEEMVAGLSGAKVDLPAREDELTPVEAESNVTRDEFESAVASAREAIVQGEAFQIVLSQRWTTGFPSDRALDLYRAMRSVNPSPYMFLVRTETGALVGSSPETLVKLEDGVAETHPIAGTRRRGESEEDDRRLEEELLADPKESAEHLMLVDLGRNDLGRVCTPGSVTVSSFRQIERYSHVMHIVSRVRGLLREELNAIDLLLSVFPAGTLSGAPKIRAMELIDQLETTRRDFYGGAVAYFDFAGNLDSCIAIRSIWLERDLASIQAGAGIVFDSDPSREYEETIEKSRSARAAVALARRLVERSDR